ncbi:hypothetical protein [Chryseobacterium sp. Leaf405]|nr:hypothetical protein [Chryseobacterium sp. Leaf405]
MQEPFGTLRKSVAGVILTFGHSWKAGTRVQQAFGASGKPFAGV